MGRISILFVLAWMATGLAAVHAERLYKWTDDQGHVSYHDQPPPSDTGYRVEEKDLGTDKKPVAGDTLSKAEEKYPVTLYSVPSCGSCDLARAYLKKRQVPFTEQNLENDVEQQQKLKKKTGSLSVPTITIGSKVMKGYVESVLEGELDDAGYPKIKPTPGDENKDQGKAPDAGS